MSLGYGILYMRKGNLGGEHLIQDESDSWTYRGWDVPSLYYVLPRSFLC